MGIKDAQQTLLDEVKTQGKLGGKSMDTDLHKMQQNIQDKYENDGRHGFASSVHSGRHHILPIQKHMWPKPLVFCNVLFSNHVNSALLSKIN